MRFCFLRRWEGGFRSAINARVLLEKGKCENLPRASRLSRLREADCLDQRASTFFARIEGRLRSFEVGLFSNPLRDVAYSPESDRQDELTERGKRW